MYTIADNCLHKLQRVAPHLRAPFGLSPNDKFPSFLEGFWLVLDSFSIFPCHPDSKGPMLMLPSKQFINSPLFLWIRPFCCGEKLTNGVFWVYKRARGEIRIGDDEVGGHC